MKKSIPQIVKEIKNFKPPNLEYAYQKQISFSQFSIYHQCPHRWAVTYRDGNFISESSINTTFGTAIHNIIQKYLSVVYEKSGAEADRMDLEELFEDELKTQYRIDYEKNGKKHFSNSEELNEFYEDGLEILKYLKKNRKNYFDQKGVHFIGAEIPLMITPNPKYNNVIYKGYLDLIFYYEKSNTIKIIDIKTSTRGWRDYEKKDPIKTSQLLLYKKFLSDLFNFPIDNISIEYLILKRKLPETTEFHIKRFQTFTPSDGKTSINKAIKNLDNFISDVFNRDGTFILNKEYEKRPSKFNCGYCPFSKSSLCGSAILE